MSKHAMQRIAAYIERRKKAQGIDVQCIHAFDLSPDGGFELLLSDIEEIIRKTGRVNPGTWYRLTDRKGKFWEAGCVIFFDHVKGDEVFP